MKKLLTVALLVVGYALAQEPVDAADHMADQQVNKSEQFVNIGLSEELRSEVAQRLNALLSDEYALYVKTQKFHWNVVGPHFGPLHKLFNKQYDELAEFVDAIAERVRALGFVAFGSFAEFAAHTSIVESPGENPSDLEMVRLLLNDHEAIIRSLHEQIEFTATKEDLGTENFLADLIMKHQKMAWMLRAHLLGK